LNPEGALLLSLVKNRKEEALHRKGIPLSKEEIHHQKDIPQKKGEDHHQEGIPRREEDHHQKDIPRREENHLQKDIPRREGDHHQKDIPRREEAPRQGDIPLKGKQVEGELRVVEDLQGMKNPGGLHHRSMVAEDQEEEVQEEDHQMLDTTLIETVLGGLLVGMNIGQDQILVDKKHPTVEGGPLTQGEAQEDHHQGHSHTRIFMEGQLPTPLVNTVDTARRSGSHKRSQDQRALHQKT